MSTTGPVTPNQDQVLIAEEIAVVEGRRAVGFNIVEAVRVPGSIDESLLKTVANDMVLKHSALRTTFARNEEMPAAVREREREAYRRTRVTAAGLFVAVESFSGRPSISVVAAQTLSKSGRARLTARICHEESLLPVGQSVTTRLRIQLIREDERWCVLVLSVPWLNGDRESVSMLIGDIAVACCAVGPIRKANPTRQFREFAAEQNARANSPYFNAAAEYWTARWEEHALGGDSNLSGEGPLARTVRAGSQQYEARLENNSRSSIIEVAGQLIVAPAVLLLTSFAILMSKWSGRSIVPCWIAFANRLQDGDLATVGCVSNVHLVDVRCERSMTWRECVEACRAALVSAQQHQELPLPLLWRRIRKNLWAGGPFVMFDHRSWVDDDFNNVGIERLTVPPSNLPAGTLYWRVVDTGSEYRVTACGSGAWCTARELETGVLSYVEWVRRIAQNIDRPVGQVAAASAADYD